MTPVPPPTRPHSPPLAPTSQSRTGYSCPDDSSSQIGLHGENLIGGIRTTLLPPHGGRSGQATQLTIGNVPTIRQVDHGDFDWNRRNPKPEPRYRVWEKFNHDSPDGTTCDGRKEHVIARRNSGETAFVLVHEPFVPDNQPASIANEDYASPVPPRIDSVQHIPLVQGSDDAVAVRIDLGGRVDFFFLNDGPDRVLQTEEFSVLGHTGV